MTEERKKEILIWTLEQIPLHVFNKGILAFSHQGIWSYVKNAAKIKFQEFNNSDLWFNVYMTQIFKPYAVDEIACVEIRSSIDKMERQIKLYPKTHQTRHELIAKHNEIVTTYNAMLRPQNELRKLYRKILKTKTHA